MARRRCISSLFSEAFSLLCILLVLFAEAILAAPDTPDHSIIAPLANRSLLLAGAHTHKGLFVVGERGHVLVTEPDSTEWRQISVPARIMLNGISFHDGDLGWIVGHDLTILRTVNGGQDWQQAHSSTDDETPLFDVWFSDKENGFAVGAYGLFITSDDSGKSWHSGLIGDRVTGVDTVQKDLKTHSYENLADLAEDQGDIHDYHLNDISVSANGKLYIAAEAGALYRSDNNGGSWQLLPSPYDGSFFGTLPLSGDSLLAFGLRGRLFRSDDAGDSWERLETGTEAALNAGVILADGKVVIAGLEGVVLVSEDSGYSFGTYRRKNRRGISAVIPQSGDRLILLGEGGPQSVTLAEIIGQSGSGE